MPLKTAFPAIPLDPRRSLDKPRKSGLTMVTDYQMSLDGLAGLLDLASAYIDIYKIATGTARLFPREHLVEKLALLRRHDVRPFLGGQMQEYVMHVMGIDAMPDHLKEAREVGFDMIEISDNIVDLGLGTRDRLINLVKDAGLSPVGEIGDKRDKTDPVALIAEVNAVLAEGAELAMIEGQELMLDGQPNAALILMLKDAVDVSRCMFELSTPRVGSTTPEIYAGKKFLVKTFGPDVNLGNVTTDVVIETETTRLGLGSAGPLSLM
ncbi:MAG: phosphosulfolactate synthase [Alphaproteobacteria bacterium]